MDIEFHVLNQVYTFEERDSFEMEQNSEGEWVIKIDGVVTDVFDFAPSNVTIEN